jgi:hypothetical protein
MCCTFLGHVCTLPATRGPPVHASHLSSTFCACAQVRGHPPAPHTRTRARPHNQHLVSYLGGFGASAVKVNGEVLDLNSGTAVHKIRGDDDVTLSFDPHATGTGTTITIDTSSLKLVIYLVGHDSDMELGCAGEWPCGGSVAPTSRIMLSCPNAPALRAEYYADPIIIRTWGQTAFRFRANANMKWAR